MDDLISRQAVLGLPRNITRNLFGEIVEESINVKEIESLPSAQPERCEDCVTFGKTRLLIPQPEIIRCRDCKHWDKTWTNNWSPDYHYCPVMGEVRKGDRYCRYSERRTDEQTSER